MNRFIPDGLVPYDTTIRELGSEVLGKDWDDWEGNEPYRTRFFLAKQRSTHLAARPLLSEAPLSRLTAADIDDIVGVANIVAASRNLRHGGCDPIGLWQDATRELSVLGNGLDADELAQELAAHRRCNGLLQRLRQVLVAGPASGYALRRDGKLWEIQPEYWASERADGSLDAGTVEESDVGSPVPDDQDRRYAPLLFKRDDMPGLLQGIAVRDSAVSPSSARARRAVEEWLRQLVQQGPKSGTKANYLDRAKREYPALSNRSFDDAWRRVVPDDWKRPGAPRR